MKLRSHDSGASSSKGKAKVEYKGSSEEDDGGGSSDYIPSCDEGEDDGGGSTDYIPSCDEDDGEGSSDYIPSCDEGEDLLEAVGSSKGREVSNLNLETARGNSDDDGISKWTEENLLEKLGRQSSEKAQEDEGKRYTEGDNGTAIGIDPGEINLTSDVGAKDGMKKKRRKKKPLLMWQVIEKENNRWIEENMQIDMDLIDQDKESMEIVEPSDDLIIPLIRFQKEWLAWALKQEESSARGGILADEMGMGKTLQAIALVLLKRSISSRIPEHDLNSSSSSSSRKEQLLPVKGTIVICPTVAVKQWEREIRRSTSEGSTKVLVYHGVNRAKNLYQICDYDFVVTTYSTVEVEFRKYVLPPKVECPHCRKSFYTDKMFTHWKYKCLNRAFHAGKLGTYSGKISSDKYLSEIKFYTRKKNSDEESKEKSILHSVSWERIVLDEAHFIKQRSGSTTNAVLALQSRYKWALTGTPLQNNVGELYSLVRFLRIVPYSYYFCKDCNCHVLNRSASIECHECAHETVRHFCWWYKYLGKPLINPKRWGGDRGAILLLKHKILKNYLLRRTKEGRAADLSIPSRIVTVRRDSLDFIEEDFYTALYNRTKAHFDEYNVTETILNNYIDIVAQLALLCQAVDHPYLVEYSRSSMKKGKAVDTRRGKAVDTRSDIKCGICDDPEEETVVTSCGHIVCNPCLIDFSSKVGENLCPSCSKPITVDCTSNKDGKKKKPQKTIPGFRSSSILNRIHLNNFQTSTKINALREEIRFMVERDASAKGIVFSQYPSFLDLIRYALEKSGVPCVQSDGSMSIGAKDAAVIKFNEDLSCRILLLSLKTGGVALNLTAASHVFLMDPCWNPGMDRQAQDRIHRIGQCKPTRFVRFIAKNTIEERILAIQEKKETVFEGTVGGHALAMEKLTEDDLRSLFVT